MSQPVDASMIAGAGEQAMETTTTTQATEVMPTPPLTQRLFRGHDLFSEFSPDPFRSGGSHRLFGSSFSRVMQRLEGLSESILGTCPMLPQSETIPGAARYSVQSASMSSWLGDDGQIHTEQFASSDVGDRGHDIRETHQAYSNTCTGEQKRALEQHLGQRGVKSVKQRAGPSAAEESRDMFLGLESAEEREEFKQDFASKAKHLPDHQSFTGRFFQDFGAGSSQLPGAGGWRPQGALEGSKGGA
eukprot:TRINITY_DN16130_c0_g1_i1.p1 TRINITY_DN16130_c0_g1~~TRINITY_DN16130_c0_g1_i1.p1  ORF type:complete len:245 (-),score=60.38 TRINITY_DN16130_c0_g1_i1:14-748(-)